MLYMLYRNFIGSLDLSNITYGEDVILCGGVCLAGLLDVIIVSYLIMLSINITLVLFTGKNIGYWTNKKLYKSRRAK